MIALLAQTTTHIGAPILGVIIPAFIFGFSFLVTYLLIRHFMKQNNNND
ncbi:MAG: hypothetical protein GXO74_16685 [Calditrichaeota bacterium]|nr:hypothetical protein [Calditrichota bacterium]